MNVALSYKPNVNDSILFLRAMIVFSSADDMHMQVTRCKNHAMQNDKNRSKEMQRYTILRHNINNFDFLQTFQSHTFFVAIIQTPTIAETRQNRFSVNVYRYWFHLDVQHMKMDCVPNLQVQNFCVKVHVRLVSIVSQPLLCLLWKMKGMLFLSIHFFFLLLALSLFLILGQIFWANALCISKFAAAQNVT